ncbi:fibronectin type III domain-containing protein [Streptomyces sp. NPDC006334]|uniref:fibronectin type III domain-containing protein n=1 Tax=Streptomyces sp. NPDC006334 TaxID=3156754 RepID=UPI0033B142FF
MHLRKLRTKPVTRAAAVTVLACTTALLDVSLAVAADITPPVSADLLDTWQTDGIVWSMAAANGVVYVGGTFDSVRPPGAAPGQGEVPRHNFAAFDSRTGRLLPCAPQFTGLGRTVRALKVSPDSKVLYVGGSFNKVGSSPVNSAVAFNTAGCGLRKDFRPSVSATVRAIDATDSTVYLGGDFGRVNNEVRNRIAAVTTKGALLPFKAQIDQPVRALSAVASHGRIFVGGDFEAVNGRPARSLVALHAATGKTLLAYPGWFPYQSSVKAIARDKTRFYVGAEGHGPGIFDGRIAGLLANGTMVWKDTCRGATQALIPWKGILFSASHAHDCNQTPGGFPERGDRQHLLAQSLDDRHILHWFPDTNDGLGEQVGPRALAISKGHLWVGGEFTRVNDKPQQGIARFGSRDTGAPAVPSLGVSDVDPGRVTLTWLAAWDRDDASLTYRVYRDGKLVGRKTQASTYWDRPRLTYTDTVGDGAAHKYTIEVTDGTNTSGKSRTVTATASKPAQRAVAGPSQNAPDETAAQDETSAPGEQATAGQAGETR